MRTFEVLRSDAISKILLWAIALVVVVALAVAFACSCHAQCGSEKSSEKDLSFADTTFLSHATTSTVKAEGSLPVTAPPALVTAHATIYAYKLESDGDIHAAIRDDSSTMIAEFPNPECPLVKRSSRFAQMKAARAWFIANIGTPTAKMKKCNIAVVLTGVRFMDKLHGQFGAAKNGVELHPVLSATLRVAP